MNLAASRGTLVALASIQLLSTIVQPHVRGDTEVPRIVLGPAAKDLVVGPSMNATGRDLRNSEFVGQDLRGAVFDDCDLYNVQIFQCDLSGASFCRSVFRGAKVGECQLKGAVFTDAVVNANGLSERNFAYTLELSPEQLMTTRSYKSKDLRQSVICGLVIGSMTPPTLDFRGANLGQALLKNGDFSKSDFSGARIYQTTFRNCTLTSSQLASTADFARGRLSVQIQARGKNRAGLTGRCDFSEINLRGSTLGAVGPDADFTDTVINDCTISRGLTKTQLYSTKSYKQGNLTNTTWSWIDFSGCNLARLNLTGAEFGQCDFTDASLEDAVISDVNFIAVSSVPWGCKGLTVEQIKSTWNYKHGRMEGIRLPDDVAEALEQE
jgi:uncharacterized protein YjbI with pentapeptide repeats